MVIMLAELEHIDLTPNTTFFFAPADLGIKKVLWNLFKKFAT